MIKKYRRRFVALNMSLIAAVLLLILIGIGVYVYKGYYSELEVTMSHVLGPLDTPNEKFHSIEPPDDKLEELRDERRQRDGGGEFGNKKIISIFYNSEDGSISVLDDNSDYDSSLLSEYVNEIVESSDSYGRLSHYGIIYYKVSLGSTYKIAVADTSYINGEMLKTILVLVAVFAIAMLLFYPISRKLSGIAAKPMEDAIEMERQFVTDISHDLKTPITVILANNSILKENTDLTVKDNIQWVDSTDASARNMLSMVNEMLTLSSLEEVGESKPQTKVLLSSAAEKAVLQMESVAFERGILIDSEIDENVFICANEDYANRICSSLIENAIKYESDNGRVEVKLKSGKKKAVLTVKNFGSVISPEDLPHVFERFYRSDKSRTDGKGHGLGLSIVKRMTEIIGAQIEVESSKDLGTVFTVTFVSQE